MTITASGRAALILATGLFVCFSEPSRAAATGADDKAAAASAERVTSGKSIRHSSRHWKRYTHRRYGRVASNSSETRKAADSDAADNGLKLSAIPAKLADANAQMTSADAPANMASAMSAKAGTMLLAAADRLDAAQPVADQPVADAPPAASDQLSDADRVPPQVPPSVHTVGIAPAQASAAEPVLAASNDDWDKTSLIGKIFIGFGALLTMASAARMLMA
jgi:hypothetical protein